MAGARVVHEGQAGSAHEHLRQRADVWFWRGLLLAALIHFPLLAYWPAFRVVPPAAPVASELAALELRPAIEVPQPPPPVARPAVPVAPTRIEIDHDITIAPTTFELQPPRIDLRPPPAAAPEDISQAPVFTPYSVAPRLVNRAEIQRELSRRYERLGRVAGVVVLWFFIDEDGIVRNSLLKQPCEYEALNAAALEVSRLMRFSPALDRDQRVPAWVALPIRFVQH